MDKYLTLFNNHQAYTNYKNSSNFATPNVSYCEQDKEIHFTSTFDYYSQEYLTIESLEDNNMIYFKTSNDSTTRTILVSTDNGNTWAEYTSSKANNGTIIATLNNGDKLLLKGENSSYADSSSKYNKFIVTKNFNIKGNIMSLISGDLFVNTKELVANYALINLFNGCSKLQSAKNLILPATTLSDHCYYQMFQDCTNLIDTPELPATTLAKSCYHSMFVRCTSLTTAPELSAMTLANYCYCYMFCGSGITVPPILPATILAEDCYESMFNSCENLTVAPELPAITLANYCYYQMFKDCINLAVAPELPVTTLAEGCYGGMFYHCTSLTTAPELPALILKTGCYDGMFYECTNLIDIPELPATTLAERCYRNMFVDCTSLITAPTLPATTLIKNCYAGMFSGCTNLNSITCFATNISANYCTFNWVSEVSSTGTFTKAASMESWTTGVNGIPTGWTVQTASA